MSYLDDEELKIGEIAEEDDDLDPNVSLDDPLLDDDALASEDDDTAEGFADLDGSSY